MQRFARMRVCESKLKGEPVAAAAAAAEAPAAASSNGSRKSSNGSIGLATLDTRGRLRLLGARQSSLL